MQQQTINKELLTKIQKCLELARRGGTEGEAEAAMRKVQMYLAKYNLNISEIENHSEVEPVESERDKVTGGKVSWHRTVYQAISKLYFCGYYYSATRSYTIHTIIGKPSNIAVARDMAKYVIELGDRLSREYSDETRMRGAFVRGFSSRIYYRVQEEIQRAKRGEVVDENTGTSLILHPLYDKAALDVQMFLAKAGVKLGSVRTKETINRAGFEAGKRAANNISLRGNGINGSGKQGRLN